MIDIIIVSVIFLKYVLIKKDLNIVWFFSKLLGLIVFNSKKKNGGNSFSVLYKNGFMVFIGDMELFFDYVIDMGIDVDKMEFVIMLIVGLGW